MQVVMAGMFLMAMAAMVQAGTIAQHVGSTDPTTEGFTLEGTAGTDVDDGGTAAWEMQSAWGRYKTDISGADAADMSANGWVAEQTVRMDVAGLDPSAPGELVGLGVIEVAPATTGDVAFSVCLGTDASGNPTVWQLNEWGTPLPWYWQVGTVTGTGYHNYKLVQMAGETTADLYVDGSLMATLDPTPGFGVARYMVGNSAPSSFTDPMGVFLAGASLSTPGVVPEPSAVVLLVTGLIGLLAYAWKKHR